MMRALARLAVILVAVTPLLGGCDRAAITEPRTQLPQTVVLFATPKFISDFSSPDADIERFLDHYAPLTTPASQTIVIFAVANSDQILLYRGADAWDDQVDWARYTNFTPVFYRPITYRQIAGIVQAFKRAAVARGLTLSVLDQIDSGNEFAQNLFKEGLHRECFPSDFSSYDIRAPLAPDKGVFATERTGIPAGLSCGHFLADQTARYVDDLGFDGILYGNQLGTRGRWLASNGPGYSAGEAAAISEFFAYSKRALGDKTLMWFDSYNNTRVEHDTWSVPPEAYGSFDYIIAAGFCVITDPDKYQDDLASKLKLRPHPRIIATLDYVDPWYMYNSMTAYPQESSRLEDIAVANRTRVDGIVFFANDEMGQLVPSSKIEAFASRYFMGVP
jgi:hypothetical protein